MKLPKVIAIKHDGPPSLYDPNGEHLGIYDEYFVTHDEHENRDTLSYFWGKAYTTWLLRQVSGIATKAVQGEFVEVWLCYDHRPWAIDSTWERVR